MNMWRCSNKEASILEEILDTVKTIEENTEDILDRFEELLEAKDYEPSWHTTGYVNDTTYE